MYKRQVHSTDDPDQVLIEYHDKVTAGNGKKVSYPEGKGAVCCAISEWFFKYIEKNAGCLTHFIDRPSSNTMLCKKLTIIPVEVIVRNIAAGSIVRQTPFPEGMEFDPPLVEFNLKDDEKDDPLLTSDRVSLMGYDPVILARRASQLNFHFKKVFGEIGLTVVDFKLEYGHASNGGLYLADEISPDSFRLWKDGKSFDKDLFRKDKGDIVEAYTKILSDLRGVTSMPNDLHDLQGVI